MRTVNRETLQTLQALTERALEGLFGPLCGAVSIRDASDTAWTELADATLAAAIGFRSPCLSGELILLAPSRFVEDVLPPEVRGRQRSARIAADWVGELVNQLVGRLKNQLLGYGVDVGLGTPRAVTPNDIVSYEHSMRAIARLSLSSGEGTVLALLYTDGLEDVALATSTPGAAVSEGDIVLF